MRIVSDYYDCIDYLQDYNDPRTFVRKSEVFHTYTANKYRLMKPSEHPYAQGYPASYMRDWISQLRSGYYYWRGREPVPNPNYIPEDLESYCLFISFFNEDIGCRVKVTPNTTKGDIITKDRPEWSDYSFTKYNKQNTVASWIRDWAVEYNNKPADNPNVQSKITHMLVLTAGADTWIIANPPLSKFSWILEEHKPEEVFQDIEQFLWSGVESATQRPVPNKIKVESHGFDSKKSFRKEKENGK